MNTPSESKIFEHRMSEDPLPADALLNLPDDPKERAALLARIKRLEARNPACFTGNIALDRAMLFEAATWWEAHPECEDFPAVLS